MGILEKLFIQKASDFTKTEKRIVEHILANKGDLPFETAASLAEKVDTTPMTVGRFLRSLGYQGMDALRKDLQHEQQEASLPITDRFKNSDELSKPLLKMGRSLKSELDGITAVYELMCGPVWQKTVRAIEESDKVYVTSFATLEGVADSFVARLRYVRPGVQYISGRGGMYLDAFGQRDEKSCVILIDDRRYAKDTKKISSWCKDHDIPLILITDEYCLWAAHFTELHLSVPTSMPSFWTSLAPMVCLLTHLVNALMNEDDKELSARMERIGQLQKHFEFFED